MSSDRNIKFRHVSTKHGDLLLYHDNTDPIDLIEATIDLAIEYDKRFKVHCEDILAFTKLTISHESLLRLDSFALSIYQLRNQVKSGKTFIQAFHDSLASGLAKQRGKPKPTP